METEAVLRSAPLLGRDVELETLREFSTPDPTGRALVIVGEPGIGKTSLWEVGLTIYTDTPVQLSWTGGQSPASATVTT